MAFPDPSTIPERVAATPIARNFRMTINPGGHIYDPDNPNDRRPLVDPEGPAMDLLRRIAVGPINLEAHAKAPHTPKPGAAAARAADELDALLVIAEHERDPEYKVVALDNVCTSPGGIADALGYLDGADVEYIARCVIDRLRAKAKSQREASK